MRRLFIPHYLLIGAILTVTALTGNALAQSKTAIKQTNARPTTALGGDELFKEFCAVCHGADAKGNGPAASALKTSPGDLTQIARRNDNKFPGVKVRYIITGADAAGAHGNRDMPVWGAVFKSISPNETFAQMRVEAVVKYLQSLQR